MTSLEDLSDIFVTGPVRAEHADFERHVVPLKSPAPKPPPAGMQARQRWRFGPFEADAQEHRLLRDGQEVALTRKAFAVLACLLGRPGRLFTRTELFDTVWAGSVVTDAALSRVIRELRLALDDDAAAPRYIATAHGLGFRFVALVSPEQPLPEAPPIAASAGRRLVGRDAAAARLDAALAQALAGHRQVLFVTGEAGIGKTSLVEDFIERHAGHGICMAQGRCIDQYGNSEAYLPILEALENLARQLDAEVVREVLARYAPAWLALLPWLAHDADAAVTAPAQQDTTAQRMLREIAQALEVLAAVRPIMLWLEDLHWSDPSSLAVVSFLAGRRDPARLLLIASYRPADVAAGTSPLQGLVLQLQQRAQARPLALDPLDAGAVADYLRQRFDGAAALPVQALAAFVQGRTNGNPLFTVAVVDDLVRRGTLVRGDGTWSVSCPVADISRGLPDDLRQLVHAQIERLADADRLLIEAAAVAGADFSAAALAAALQSDIGDVEERCNQLALQGRFLHARPTVAWPDGTHSASFGFLHALYWQGTYERVPQSRRAEWNRRIGLRLEQAWAEQCSTIATELAMRFEAARDIERCLRYLQMAGSQSLARCAYPESVELLRHALTLLPELPASARALQELELLLPLGAALMAAQGYASQDVEATYQRALELCELLARPGDLERALRGLWNVAFLRADLERAKQMAVKLLAQSAATGDRRMAADAHAKLGQTFIHRGDLADAQVQLEAALSDAAGTDDAAALREAPRIAIYLAWVYWYLGQPARALRQAEQALDLARHVANPHSSAFALGYGSQLHYFCGNAGDERALAQQLRLLSTEHGLAFWRSLAEFTLGRCAARDDGAADGIAAMQRAIADMRAAGGQVGVPYLLCSLAEAHLAASQHDAAQLALAEAAGLVAGNGNALYAAEGLRLQGELALAVNADPSRHEAARRCFMAALSLAREQGARALELRAATSLARLPADPEPAQRSSELLAGVYAGFSDGLETADLLRARLQLEARARGVERPGQ
jgi:predicted ATPase/DNA-binding winged helix-turn-helix (wHTH) protein